MFFSGGLVPSFLLVRNLGLYDNRWALILPTAVSTYNFIVMRTAFAACPDELEEAAMIDGAHDFRILIQIILPVAKATLAVIVLFYYSMLALKYTDSFIVNFQNITSYI